MITPITSNNQSRYVSDNARATEFYGLSTDSKPTDAKNGAVYIEMDTGKLYFFDEANTTWHEVE